MAIDLTQVETCNECGKPRPKASPVPFCGECQVYMQVLLLWNTYLYQRWGVLPYE